MQRCILRSLCAIALAGVVLVAQLNSAAPALKNNPPSRDLKIDQIRKAHRFGRYPREQSGRAAHAAK